MTHTDTLATLTALRTALRNLEAPTPGLAARTAPSWPAHTRATSPGLADHHEAAAARLYERIAEHLTDRPIAAAAYALAADTSGDVPPLARLLQLDHRVNTPTPS